MATASAEEKESFEEKNQEPVDDDAKSTDSFEKEASSLVDNMTTDSVGLQNKSTKVDWAHNNLMLSVKDERKRAEYDVQLLANRLAYLRSEEKAASKKVADTKLRARDIAQAKEKARKHDEMKNQWKQSLKAKEEANRECFRAQREERQNKLRGARNNMVLTRKEAASSMRDMSRNTHRLSKSGQLNTAESDQEKKRSESYQFVKNTHRLQKEKEAKRRHEHELFLKKQVETKVAEERRRKEDAEKLIAQFEAEEAILIQRLRDTQIEHHGALSELEKTLLSP
mmetsp:Transcript_5047/g.6538  ORF Transcript_5047/g.6538 Transcript_5047/m.6538 type:complete len:283 (+) Transcript_5047:124-972(+)|eukprot:CAMPEP_0114357106 /NCGR_PEP_ID=MMETSP0101-20121206/21401_1 /TAXON_ID=38822 ORGANISM="Pteridomonas danica, Strain PT" /NCGR_SAMPLE_ID=MMETSP0101 /ASSEMBLY_ACC=CAM_ASM_000211 /LENGTH=282 /DNA_ID=CAMNT_0001499749 /DNA_START=46 /DNA_END=894 /DNA_ORIENTATION=+